MADIPGSAATETVVTVGSTVNGQLEASADRDWYRLQLAAGEEVAITLSGQTLDDPHLRIRDSAGNIVFENDDIRPDLIVDSRIIFTAPSAGTYFVDVGGSGAADTGTYTLAVEPYVPLPVWTVEEIAEFLVSDFHEGNIHHHQVAPAGTLTFNVTALNAAGQFLAREAIALWSDIIGVTFNEVTAGGNITFDDNKSGAYANIWQENGIISSAHVNIEASRLITFGATVGSYSFQNYIHEIGHALGLGHAGFYPLGPADPYTDALFANDARSTTAMSYFPQDVSTYFVEQGFSNAFLVTPMIADVAAMGMLYGLSTTTRSGDTTYGFNSNAGRASFDAALHPDVAYTLFDSGGIDTLDYSGFVASQVIRLSSGEYSNVGGLTGNVVIALGTLIENAIGGSGDDHILGNSAGNLLTGGGGSDTLGGGLGSDTLTGGAGGDTFTGTAAELSGDTITDFAIGDRIVIANASLASFTHSLSGSTLTYSGGSLSFGSALSGSLVATAAAGGGVQLVLTNDPPTPSISRAKLILTQGGQDVMVGGNVAVLGTSTAGEVIEIVGGNVSLDASFNAGGDTVVLPGNAGSYTAVLSGSFVTISGGDVTVAIPVGIAGIAVQFANSTRTLEIEGGQVVLGTQQITTTAQPVAASGPGLVDPAET
ncbi:MAG TPA: M10 family metallopeptidase C-terminal domain-containing protein, partial [Sphingomicrobium sp.]|nr:M10 family metallopeptidase C-terminal domain-containing protein [Sphingomicrobium sp.]